MENGWQTISNFLGGFIVGCGVIGVLAYAAFLQMQERFSDQQAQWVDPDPDALADDPYLEALLDRALALTDTQRMVVAGEIERLLAEYGRPVPGYEAGQ